MIKLALLGGAPIRTGGWPRWPQATPATLQALTEVLDSGRWAISGPYAGRASFEQRFAEAFASFCGTKHCVPTASGTASLMIALEALGVGADADVIVPGLTWVASASAVVGVNAVPVLVDIDPQTLCISPDAVEAAITPRTRAICAVHLYSGLSDLDRLLDIANRYHLPLIEDCAQAHGATYRDKRVGSLGAMGVFSMQHSKLLTSGEGGAVITDDDQLASRAAQLRADGRLFLKPPPASGEMELYQVGDPMGNNRCLSEFQAAVLYSLLDQLPVWNETRARNASILNDALGSSGTYRVQGTAAATTGRTYYEYAFSIDPDFFEGIPVSLIAAALSAELSMPFDRIYPPLNNNKLYQPETRSRFRISEEHVRRIAPRQFELPECRRAYERTLIFHHRFLLGGPEHIRDLSDAFLKVSEQRDALIGYASKSGNL